MAYDEGLAERIRGILADRHECASPLTAARSPLNAVLGSIGSAR
jgi:hypothetical protein